MSPAQALGSPVFASRKEFGLAACPEGFRGGEFTVQVAARRGRRGDRRGTSRNAGGQPSRRDGRYTSIGGTPGGRGRGQSGLAPYCTSETLPLMKITFISL